jgi:hypothetical protein
MRRGKPGTAPWAFAQGRARLRVGLPGPVAQRLEPAAHNGLVGGSSPSRPTTLCPDRAQALQNYPRKLPQELILDSGPSSHVLDVKNETAHCATEALLRAPIGPFGYNHLAEPFVIALLGHPCSGAVAQVLPRQPSRIDLSDWRAGADCVSVPADRLLQTIAEITH